MMPETLALPRKLMLATAVAQGLLLFGLYKTLDLEYWPSTAPLWFFPLWTLALVLPLVFLLSIDEGNTKRVLTLTCGFGAILALSASYIGWQAQPFEAFPTSSLTGAFALSIFVACFKALMYLQQISAQRPMSYRVLFTYSWQNFLVTTLSILFVLAFWAILSLWSSLFKVIEINFFADLFKKDWFIFPVLGFANGLGIIIFRELTKVIDSITRLLQGLIKLLLPLVVGVAAIFLIALPFTGLEVLWATGSGTSLLLWLTALILFFVNAVYQDGRGDAPYPDIIHRLIYAGLFVLPFLSSLSYYGLWLRLDQYGWTVERAWAFVIWSILTLFCGGYIWGIVRLRALWPNALGQVNTVMGLMVLAVILAANSPILDFRKLSLASQMARLDAGEVSLESLDFHYFHHHLARPGYFELERIKSELGEDDAVLLAKINNPTPIRSKTNEHAVETFWMNAVYRPEKFVIPAELRVIIENVPMNTIVQYVIILKVDLNDDGREEYAVLPIEGEPYNGQFYWFENDQWRRGSLYYSQHGQGNEAINMLREGHIELVDPPFRSLKIGDLILEPN